MLYRAVFVTGGCVRLRVTSLIYIVLRSVSGYVWLGWRRALSPHRLQAYYDPLHRWPCVYGPCDIQEHVDFVNTSSKYKYYQSNKPQQWFEIVKAYMDRINSED
jgi:hypothetical protein